MWDAVHYTESDAKYVAALLPNIKKRILKAMCMGQTQCTMLRTYPNRHFQVVHKALEVAGAPKSPRLSRAHSSYVIRMLDCMRPLVEFVKGEGLQTLMRVHMHDDARARGPYDSVQCMDLVATWPVKHPERKGEGWKAAQQAHMGTLYQQWMDRIAFKATVIDEQLAARYFTMCKSALVKRGQTHCVLTILFQDSDYYFAGEQEKHAASAPYMRCSEPCVDYISGQPISGYNNATLDKKFDDLVLWTRKQGLRWMLGFSVMPAGAEEGKVEIDRWAAYMVKI